MRAYAFVVGPEDGPGKALAILARSLDFFGVSRFSTLAEAEEQSRQTPVCYFLFAATEEVRMLRSVADAIRFSPARGLRFSPLIYFAQDPSVETITACINLGFDDVVTLPTDRRRMIERLGRHVGQKQVYYETATYFGPDRRGRLTGPAHGVEARIGGRYRRLEIVRNLQSGVNVLRDDYVAGPAS
jgi:hypothetical protein